MLRIVIVSVALYFLWRLLRGHLLHAPKPRSRDFPRTSPNMDPHAVLGVQPGASPEEIRAAYQALIRQYHPDQVQAMGPELREIAEQRTKEINAAYDLLKRKGASRA